ncbi:MAG: lipopolysaccharide biosynthesis protein [Firmicutes bacterium]|nr:lipopolysaccharide biosynthesis protein [Bacillota bacterium]
MAKPIHGTNLADSHLILDLCFRWINKPLYNNAIYLMLNNIITCLLGFAFWNIMARFYTPSQVGIGASLIAASSLIGILAELGLRIGLIRFIPESRENAGLLINAVFTIAGLSSMVGGVIYLVGIKIWSPALSFIQEDIWLLLLFLIFTMMNSLSGLTDSSLIAGRASRYVLFKNTLVSILKIPLPIFIFTHLKGFGIFAGNGISIAVAVLIAWLLYLSKVYKGYLPKPVIAKSILKKVLPYSFANYMANMLNLSPQFIYPLMVLNVLGPENSAYFYIAWMMTMVLVVIPNGVSQSLLAEGSYNPHKMGRDGCSVLYLSLALSVPAVAAMTVMASWLLHFFGPGYAEYGTPVFQFLALAIIPQCINTLYITVNQIRKQVFLIIAQTGFLAIVAIGVGYWWFGRVGLPGLGMAYLLAHSVLALIVIRPLLKVLKEKSRVTVLEHN